MFPQYLLIQLDRSHISRYVPGLRTHEIDPHFRFRTHLLQKHIRNKGANDKEDHRIMRFHVRMHMVHLLEAHSTTSINRINEGKATQQ